MTDSFCLFKIYEVFLGIHENLHSRQIFTLLYKMQGAMDRKALRGGVYLCSSEHACLMHTCAVLKKDKYVCYYQHSKVSHFWPQRLSVPKVFLGEGSQFLNPDWKYGHVDLNMS